MLVTIVLPICLAAIMLSLGLSLVPDDFRRVIAVPRGVAIGMVNLILVSPLLALGIAELTGLPPLFAVGLVLLGASPGGVMSNMFTHLARGATALSVTMTALSSLTALLTVPLYLDIAARHFGAGELGPIDITGVVVRLLLIAIVPISLGMLIRQRRPDFVARQQRRIGRISLALFLLVVAAAVVSEATNVLDHFAEVALAAVLLNVAAMSISFAVAKTARLDDRQATAISLELGIHNAALAIAVGSSINTELAVPAAMYSMFMFITGGLFARLMARHNARYAPSSEEGGELREPEPEPEPEPAVSDAAGGPSAR